MAWSVKLRVLFHVLVSGLEVSSGLAMSFGGSKAFEHALRLLWWFLSGMGCGFWPGSKVSAEMISFL